MSNFYRLEVSPGGRRRYIREREYTRPADGIVLVKTVPGCKSTSTVVPGVDVQPLADLVSRDALAAAVVQLQDELTRALMASYPTPMTPADRVRAIIAHVLGQLKEKDAPQP